MYLCCYFPTLLSVDSNTERSYRSYTCGTNKCTSDYVRGQTTNHLDCAPSGMFTSASVATTGGIYLAPFMQLNWQSSDLTHLAGSTTPTSIPSLQSSSSSQSPLSSVDSHPSLPRNATIGVAVAIGIVGLALLVLVPYLLLRWRRKRQRQALRISGGRWDKAELPQDHARLPGEMGSDGEVFELPADWGAEMPAREDFVELHGSRAMYELEETQC